MRTALQIVSDHYAASKRNDLPAMVADFAVDLQWTEMAGFPCAGTYTGTQQIIENVFVALGKEWVNFTVTLERLIDGGSYIAAVADYHATYKKTGKPMHARVVHVWQVVSEKITRFEQFADTKLVADAMV
jgi:ketosteroid isomerase-like protein